MCRPLQIQIYIQIVKYLFMFQFVLFFRTPTTETMQQPTWPVYSSDTQQYIKLSGNMTSLSVQQRFVAARIAFWADLIPALQNCSTSMTSPGDNNDTSGTNIVTLNIALALLLFCFL